MLRSENVRVGMGYVNEREGVVREVIDELDRFRIRYNEFELRTGRLRAPAQRVTYRRAFARWASREATPRELAWLHPNAKLPWSKNEKPQEQGKLEHEHARARMEQVVQSSVTHRW